MSGSSNNLGNTIGLYQLNTGTGQGSTSAQALLTLLSNASTVGFSLTNANTQVQGTVLPSGVISGTYGDAADIPVITVGEDGRVTTITTIPVDGGGSTYSNANVAAYLPVYGGTISAGTIFNDSGFAIQGRDYTQMQFTNGVTPPTSEYDIGVGSWFYLDSGGGVFQSNTTGTLKTIILGNDASINAGGNITAPYFIGDGSLLTGIGGTYGNANVAAFMANFGVNNINMTGNIIGPNLVSGENVIASNILATTYFLGNAALMTNLTGAATGTYGSSTVIPTIVVDATGRITQITTNAVSGGGSYGNANVAAYLPTYTGSMPNLTSINTTGNITANAGGYVKGDGSLLTNLPTQAGTYSNTNVTAYLTTATISTTGNITAANLTTAGNLTASYVKGDGSLLTNLPTQAGTYSNTNVTAYLAGTVSVGNIKSTSGYFWANGTAYSTGGGGTSSFSGNLLGNALIDTTNNRVTVNASPFSDPGIEPPLWQNMKNNGPVYIGGVLQAPLAPTNNLISNDSYLMFTTSNIALQSSYQTTNTRFMSGILNYQSAWPVTANTMTNSDRLRNTNNTLEYNMAGKSWGTTGSSTFNSVIGTNINFLNLYGNGYVTSGATMAGVAYVTPIGTALGTGLSANITYLTGVSGVIQHQTTYGSTNTANITTARGYLAQVSIGSNSVAVTNAIGFHTPSGWVNAPNSTGGLNITNRYAFLNEDSNSEIQTNGNLTVLGNTSIRGLKETVSYLVGTGGAVTINAAAGTIQTLTLTSSISSLTFTNLPIGGTVTLIITQGGTGSYTLTTTGIKYAGGSSTLSTAVGAIDMLNILYDGYIYYGSLVKGYA